MMSKNKFQAIHCNCGVVYLVTRKNFANKATCPECGRTVQVERLEAKLSLSQPIANRFLVSQKEPFLSTFSNKSVVLAIVAIVSIVGIAVNLANSSFQQKQLPNLPNLSQLAPEPIPSKSPISLANATNIIPPQDLHGLSQLKVSNGTIYDAVVKLVDSKSGNTQRFVYVRANLEATIKNISPCSCILKFSQGRDWDISAQKFLYNRSFWQFSNPIDFKEIKKDTGVEWIDYQVTLHPVATGTATTQPINESDFDEK